MSTLETEKAALVAKGVALWAEIVGKGSSDVPTAFFTTSDEQWCAGTWQSVSEMRAQSLEKMLSDEGFKRSAVKAHLAKFDRLLEIRGSVTLMQARKQGKGAVDQVTTAPAPAPAPEPDAREKQTMQPARTAEADPELSERMEEARAAGRGGGALLALSGHELSGGARFTEAGGPARRVDRLDGELCGLLQRRAEASLERHGVLFSARGNELPMNWVVNAALAAVLVAGGSEGVSLDESAQALVEAVTDGADLGRGAAVDAQLSLIRDRLDRIEKTGRSTHAKTVEIEKQGWLGNLLSSTLLADRLHLVEMRPGPHAIDDVDVVAPGVLSLLAKAGRQGASERTRRRDARGRPGSVSRALRMGKASGTES